MYQNKCINLSKRWTKKPRTRFFASRALGFFERQSNIKERGEELTNSDLESIYAEDFENI